MGLVLRKAGGSEKYVDQSGLNRSPCLDILDMVEIFRYLQFVPKFFSALIFNSFSCD